MREPRVRYEIRIEGHLATHRLRAFEGLTVHQEEDGETLILGCFRDRAALYGLLGWLQGLGVTLLLVRRMQEPPAEANAKPALPEDLAQDDA